MPNPKGVNQYSSGGGGGKSSSRKHASKAPKIAPKTVQHLGAGGRVSMISKTDAAAKMFGHGSKQHQAAIKRFGK